MAKPASSSEIIRKLQNHFIEGWIRGLPDVVQVLDSKARILASYVAEPCIVARRRSVAEALQHFSDSWLSSMITLISDPEAWGTLGNGMHALAENTKLARHSMILEGEIFASRLALSMMEVCCSEFTDLRSRVISLEKIEELDSHNIFQPNMISRVLVNAWICSGFSIDHWNTLQPVLHQEFSSFAIDQYHEANRWLLSQGVRPEIHLRPLIHRTLDQNGYQAVALAKTDLMGCQPMSRHVAPTPTLPMRHSSLNAGQRESVESVFKGGNRVFDHLLSSFAQSQQPPVVSQIKQLVTGSQQPSIDHAVVSLSCRSEAPDSLDVTESAQPRPQAIKSVAANLSERGTIEVVAWLFQSILAEERIPPIVRVWFARLQMPVLRVAVSEPDFFALPDHPARRLINRMGASVMGFETRGKSLGDALEKEIKRIVQVVEAYPDTGRRVFQTVLNEFERFLEHFFKNENEATRKGISVAQQVEQREALAIQYTIEIRKMLNEAPVPAGIREFLFHVWADVLATSAVKSGPEGEETHFMRRTAIDLIWSCSAKVSKDERAEVIRRLPILLKNLRDGMLQAGISQAKQDDHIQSINNSLATAFTTKAAAIPQDRLKDLMTRLETLEEMLPDSADVEIDESMVLDLSGDEGSELELVVDGGAMPTAPILAWARELQLGSWLILDYRGRREVMHLTWQGFRRQLYLLVSPQGRAILFQRHRLAAFLQAGLLVPAQAPPLHHAPRETG